MVRPSIKELQWQVREDAIVDAAHELIGERGYADMSMDDLASRLGISKATLYQHFPSKEDVAIRVIVRLMRRGEELLRQVDPAKPAIEGIGHWLQRGLEIRVGTPTQGMHLMPLSVKRHPLYQEQDERMYALVSALIDRAKAEGDAAPEIITGVAARVMMGLFRGDYDEFVRNAGHSREAVAATLTALVVDGLRTRSMES